MIVLYLIEELSGGGKERRLVELLKDLSKDKDFELHLILSKTINDYPEVNQLPIKIHHLNGFSNVALIREYFSILKKIEPDVVHAWSYKTSFYISLLKPFLKFKFIVGFIGDTFGFTNVNSFIANQLIFKKSDIIVSNSQIGLDAYKVPEIKGRVIHNGFNPNRISKERINKLNEMGVKTPLKVVMLANVSPYKDYQLFIDIAEHFVQLRDDITFISIGKILPKFQSLVEPYINNKHPHIKFLGFRDDVNDLIKNCDIGLLCTYSEGMSNAIIELMANGVPVITNDLNGGSKEVISNGVDGFICNDKDMLRRLQEIIDDEYLRTKISKSASNKIDEKFSWTTMVQSYKNIYKA